MKIKEILKKFVESLTQSPNKKRNRILLAYVPFSLIVILIGIVLPIKIYGRSVPVVLSLTETESETQTETEIPTETETVSDTESSSAEETTSSPTYTVKENVKSSVATGNPVVDEDAKVSKVTDNSLTDNTVAPQVVPENVPEISSIESNPEVAQIYKSQYTKYTFAAKNSLTGWNNVGGCYYYFNENHDMLTGNQTIDGIKYFFNDYGAKTSLVGIDVSRYQSTIDWAAVKNSGIDFAIIRVGFRGYGTKGSLCVDDNYKVNIEGALAAGLDVGLYFYSQATTVDEAVEEASVAVENAKGYNLTYPIYCDTEFACSDRTGRADTLSASTRTDCVVAFCEAVKNAGFKPGVYASKSFFEHNLQFSRISDYNIWLAHYTSGQTTFGYPYKVWQYTPKASVNGIKGNVDLNISYYDYAKKTDYSTRGQNVLFFDTADGFSPYVDAENLISKYNSSRDNNDYLSASAAVKALEDSGVRSQMNSALEMIHLKVLAANMLGGGS